MRALDATTADGTMDVRIFTPAGSQASLPAVVLLTDIGGLRASYDAKAQRIADNGYAVLMPNLYYRSARGQVVPPGLSFRDPGLRPTLLGYARLLTPDALARDFEALLATLDAEPEFADNSVAVVGYCMSGGMALRMAACHPERVRAAAGFHSARLAPADDPHGPASVVGAIAGRVFLGHADGDEHLPPDQIARMDEALAAAGVHFTTELFKGARHGWTATDAPVYEPAADALHFKRLFTLLEETLGASSGAAA